MSSGRHTHGDVPDIDDAFYQRVGVLVDDAMRDRNHTIPWLANRSSNGRIVYIDELVPTILPKTGLNTGETLPYHELGEWLGMNEGDDYDTAHATKGNPCEKRRVEALGGVWDDYEAEMAEYIREVGDEAITSVPSDIDQRVFMDDDDKAAIAAIATANKAFLVRGSADQPRDSHGRWVSTGGTTDQLTDGEGKSLKDVVDGAKLGDLADNVSSAKDDLESQIDDARAAADAADEAEAAGEDAEDENAAVTAQQQALRDSAVELHSHLAALSSSSAAALAAYEAQLASAGVGSLGKSGKMRTLRKFAPIEKDATLGERQIRVIASDPSVDLAKDVMVPEGCDFSNFTRNPIVLAQHNPELPIGRAQIEIRNGRVEAVIEFAPKGVSVKADEYCGLYKSGFLNAVSVGFDPVNAEPIKDGGLRFNKWTLLELSCVSVPCNPNATVIARAAAARALKADHEWKVGASRNLPIDEETSWDGPAASASIFEQAGFDGDSPDTSFARKGFLVYDAANPKLKVSYKLPFAKVKGGRLTALANGMRSAASRLPQTDIPDDVATKARAVIDHYESKFSDGGKGAGKMKIKSAAIVVKGLYGVSQLACMLEDLGWIANASAWEAEMEGDGSGVPAMLGAALKQLGDALLAMTEEETRELLATLPGGAGKSFKAVVEKSRAEIKAGKVLSQANQEHLDAIDKCMKGMAECAKGAMDCHKSLSGYHTKAAKLGDDLHGVLEQWMDHGTSAGEHVKAMMDGAKKPDDDESDDAGDNELAGEAAQRKRQLEVMQLSAASVIR